ncbi:MAG: hypothetical protein ABJE66_01410 [Deltaproteobacteria bacterium]
MRNHLLPTIPSPVLANVVGGCHKHGCPQPAQMAAPAPATDPGPRASVTVATGQAGGAAIQQALGGSAPA